jgi:hypothetical protein
MKTYAFATDISGILPLILLALFLVVPYIMKHLGRQTGAGGDHQDTEEHQPLDHQGPLHDDYHPMAHDPGQEDRSMPSNKPITPRWF